MQTDGLESQRDKFKQRIAAIAFEEDPLAVYVEFVQWTLDNFDDNDPHSGLSQLLDEATKKFKKDEAYKADLRYLKLWALYANRVSQRSAIGVYSQLWKNGFGVSYSLLYEEYASILEAVGRFEDADQVYRTGVKRHARPIERLKARYTDFRKRHGKKPVIFQDISKTNTAAACSPKQLSSAASRYATMLAPPQPGKPPEKLRFDMTLLYTEKTGEFCFEEARTRSMGLLRKEWPVLPVESLAHPARSSSLTVLRPGEGRFGKRKSMLAGEPTVTINTREALEDVFGMYNSPDRTIRMGSKHAPVKKIEPVAMPQNTTSPPTTLGDGIHKSAGLVVFQPFVDENSDDIKPRKTNKPAFTPFVDLENKTPTQKSRSAFARKDAAPHQNNNLLQDSKKLTERENTSVESIFSQKVFIPESEIQPLPLREAHTEDHGQPRPKTILTHERAKSDHDVGKTSHSVAFRPFVDPGPETSFKVFSRPSEGKSIFTPKLSTMKLSVPPAKQPTFTPYKDPAEDNIQIEPLTEKHQSHVDYDEPEYDEEFDQGNTPHQHEGIDLDQYPEEDDNDYSDDFIDEECQEDVVEPLREELVEMYDGQEVDYHDVPFGGRFGQFSVMTPITERTFEYTSTSHSTFNTPSILSKHAPVIEEEQDSQLEAAQLVPDGADEFEHENEDEARGLHDIHPLRLPSQASISTLTQSTSKLSLVDTLTLSSNFKPSNPCNPFDPPIFQALLSRLNADSHYYDLTTTDHNGYDELQKYAKKNRKTSSSSGGGDASHPLTLNGQKFVVSEKLGEGGFGAVFKARDCGALSDCDSDFEDEDEMEGEEVSMVALKVVKPRNIWEYHVLRRLHSALPPANRRSIVFPHALYAFRDESYLVLDYCPQGTLLDIVNTAESAGVSQQGACLDELLVMFFTIELLRLLEIMHAIGFIHGDLKIDNCLLRLEEVPGGPSSWSSAYRPSGEGGWSYKGLKVIDFGRTIDTRLFPGNQQFIADWETDERDCIEIQQGKPWTFQTDYFGLAGVIYCMFFGKYIQASAIGSSTSPDGKAKFRLTTPLKRYWQTDLWERLFHLLLNPVDVRSDGHMPLSEELGSIRTDMEAWLQANCNRTTGTLKGLLKKVEMSCLR
ncbi:hypothetical protein F5876DRAFT_30363 [Lentinula aff. lateritia]|uniref:Uncharacterized protein n=1 Tax=Lentinula aff. lateritia TaxID=2804960 RepID=A0ACC1UG37_9AGAR|nr:hypothetical protein F5876DRAFT_30363 [Lentinula aff. lateritia]